MYLLRVRASSDYKLQVSARTFSSTGSLPLFFTLIYYCSPCSLESSSGRASQVGSESASTRSMGMAGIDTACTEASDVVASSSTVSAVLYLVSESSSHSLALSSSTSGAAASEGDTASLRVLSAQSSHSCTGTSAYSSSSSSVASRLTVATRSRSTTHAGNPSSLRMQVSRV